MKRLLFLPMLIPLLMVPSCSDDEVPDLDFKQEMRTFVMDLGIWARSQDPGFIIIPQNGQELLTTNGDNEGNPSASYMSAIDGQGREDLFYGYDNDDQSTPAGETAYMTDFLDMALESGIQILVTDYCHTPSKMDDSYTRNHSMGYISFAADHRELDNIPSYPAAPFQENSDTIESLNDARNFLYLINPELFSGKQDFIQAATACNYDLLIMDLFFDEATSFSSSEIEQLRTKANGGKRLVVCYMSIGEAEDYRYYWKDSWVKDPPGWLHGENPDWEGNYKVFYWEKEWQDIVFGNGDSYLQMILDAGFDGVYLDIIDAFEYFEDIKG